MKSFLRSFTYAIQGIAYVLRTQRNARIHFCAAGAAIAAGALLRISPVEWAVLCLAIGLVVSTEMVNSAVELVVDLLAQRPHPLAKAAKDAGAGAVLVTALAAIGAGAAVLGPKLWRLLYGR